MPTPEPAILFGVVTCSLQPAQSAYSQYSDLNCEHGNSLLNHVRVRGFGKPLFHARFTL
jgi:hypothetical protein